MSRTGDSTKQPSAHLQLVEYGLGGDYAGSRRSRRAFRFLVTAIVAACMFLWFSENFLRYELEESNFRSTLTLEDPSARAVLRNVVKRDAKFNEVPNAKYVEALAWIEEEDMVLERFQQAHELDQDNASLILKYGIRLFLYGQYTEARERFREASLLPPKNALPRYLEAAALVMAGGDAGDLLEPFALIERANENGDPLIFPDPVWHASLPRGGQRYERLRSQMVDSSCAPLYQMIQQLLIRAEEDIRIGQTDNWPEWLLLLKAMGQRFIHYDVQEKPPAMEAVVFGICLQRDALMLMQKLAELGDYGDREGFIEERLRLENAHKLILSHQAGLADRSVRQERLFYKPWQLFGYTFLLIGFIYVCNIVFFKFTKLPHDAWNINHPPYLTRWFILGMAALYGLVCFTIRWNFNDVSQGDTELVWVQWLWVAVVAVLALGGFAYPLLVTPAAGVILRHYGALLPSELGLKELRRLRFAAYLVLLRRYYGILLGACLIIGCLWLGLHRIVTDLYPFQTELMGTGMDASTAEVIRQVRDLIAVP